MLTSHTRYPGAHPFSDDEISRKTFFGRKRESTDLANQILANRHDQSQTVHANTHHPPLSSGDQAAREGGQVARAMFGRRGQSAEAAASETSVLEELVGFHAGVMSEAQPYDEWADRLRQRRHAVQAAASGGPSKRTADGYAVAAGFHRVEVWPDWVAR